MKKNPVTRFLLRFAVFLLPIVALAGSYICLDPYGIYFPGRPQSQLIANPARDYINVNLFLQTAKEKKYNSFTLGNSRIKGFKNNYPEYLEGDVRYFDFHCPGESIYNMRRKLELADAEGLEIKNVLLALDDGIITNENNTEVSGPEYLHHPLVSKYNPAMFHYRAFRFFITDWYFVKYIDYKLFGVYRGYMKSAFNDPGKKKLTGDPDPKPGLKNPAETKNLFTPRAPHIPPSSKRITPGEFHDLEIIMAIFKKHRTRYKIVINPMYNQVPFNPRNVRELQVIFGAGNVYNFSGKNKYTESKENWFEPSHFRPSAGNEMLKEMFAK